MKTLYLDCSMGAAGDMLTAALVELFDDKQAIVAELNAMGIPGVQFTAQPSVKCGITGTHMQVTVCGGMEEGAQEHAHHHHHEHSHSSLDEICHLISHLRISGAVGKRAENVFLKIAQAESRVHGADLQHIHFHEVGSMDALADVTAVCYLMEKLGVQKVVASPVHVGSGTVKCAHGILPVPAPATELLLRGVPTYGGEIRGELCTPTGAALLKEFADAFGAQPAMVVRKSGYGMGMKDFPAANCLRASLGESQETPNRIWELQCNLDDETAEEIGFAMEALLTTGALDVFTTPIGMKKNRPGVMLTVLCEEKQKEALTACLFRNTSTLGIRECEKSRAILDRKLLTHQTPWGPVREKVATGYGVTRSKWEYEDLARIAKSQNSSLLEARSLCDAWKLAQK